MSTNAHERITALYSARVHAAGVPAAPTDARALVNFDQGLPDPRYFPVAELTAHVTATLEEDGADALRYYSTGGPAEMQYGYVGLREELAAWMGRRDGREYAADGLTLVNGSTDGLALTVNAFLGPGDGAIVESPTYPHAARFITATGAIMRTVPVDDQGMVVDRLEAELRRLADDGAPAKLIYTVPTFHAPTGTVLGLERREQLLALAERWQTMVLEDNCYYAFAYDRPPPPTLLALDGAGVVVHSDSFSKYVAPGLRLAWLAGHPSAIDGIVAVRQDFAVSQLLARAIERYVACGDLDAHLARLRARYCDKRDRTVAALRRHCGDDVRFDVPAGGFYFWVELAPEIDWPAAREMLAVQGFAFRPSDAVADSTATFVRISPIQVAVEHLDDGIAAFGAALRACRIRA